MRNLLFNFLPRLWEASLITVIDLALALACVCLSLHMDPLPAHVSLCFSLGRGERKRGWGVEGRSGGRNPGREEGQEEEEENEEDG